MITMAVESPSKQGKHSAPPAPPLFNSTLRAAWQRPERLKPSEWAEKYITLPRGQTAFPGKLDHRHAPYLPLMIDLATKPGLSELNIIKAAQMGVSEAWRWFAGWVACTCPDPMGLALPDKPKGQKIIQNRWLPLFRHTPALRALCTETMHDLQGSQIKLVNGWILHLMWSGSPSSLASDPMRFAICDEVDKYPVWSGREGHAVDLVRERLATYSGRELQVNLSTPTTPEGMIASLFAASTIKAHYLIPCPHCGAFQRMVWAQVKWAPVESGTPSDPRERAKRWLVDEAAGLDPVWYECAACAAKITERERRAALQRGRIGTAGANNLANDECPDLNTVERFPPGTSVGLHLPRLICTWKTLARNAALFLVSASRGRSALYNFYTGTLGEPFDSLAGGRGSIIKADALSIRSQQATLPEGKLPDWTARLLAAIDTQGDHFWLTIRAWGPGFRSQRIYHGRVETFADLERLLWRNPWEYASKKYAARICDLAVIDSGGTRVAEAEEKSEAEDADESGTETTDEAAADNAMQPSRVMEVYKWCLGWGSRVRAIKGSSRPMPGEFIRRGRGVYQREGVALPIWLLDVHHFQDELAELMNRTLGEPTERVETTTGEVIKVPAPPLWQLNHRDDPQYNQHMAALVKKLQRQAGKMVQRWGPITSGARVDLRACEGYQVACAYMTGVQLLPELATFLAQREQENQAAVQASYAPAQATAPTFATPDGRAFLVTNR